MATRAYKYFSITTTNVAQPMVGTTISAAVGTSDRPQNIAVADSTIFDQGTWLIIDTGSSEERMMITKIPDSTHVTVQIPGGILAPTGCQKAHASGVAIRPSRMASHLFIQALDGNAQALFVGDDVSAKIDGTRCIAKIPAVFAGGVPGTYVENFSSSAGPNTLDMAQFWIVGTIGDQYLPSIGVV